MNGTTTTTHLCEALVHHLELSGSDMMHRECGAPGKPVAATVWCVVGQHAQAFRDMAEQWAREHGFTVDFTAK